MVIYGGPDCYKVKAYYLFIFTQRLKVHSVCLLAINVAGNGPFRAPAVYTVLYSCHSEFNKDTV